MSKQQPRKNKDLRHWKSNRPPASPGNLRIIGGTYRGRQIQYLGDPRTRPMKNNIREALFNLVGGWITDRHVYDLFAGSGAVGLEALSRGAAHVTMLERHFPTARSIRDNVLALGAQDQTTIITADTFFWVRKFVQDSEQHPADPWVVFCCPPYDFYVDRKLDMLRLIRSLVEAAPSGSVFAVESDQRFDPSDLPHPEKWRVRQYSPAQISVLRQSSPVSID